MTNKERAKMIVNGIMQDLDDRKGLMDGVDQDIKDEMRGEWEKIAEHVLERDGA